MLKQDFRLRKVRDFNLLFTHGFYRRGHNFDLRALSLAKISQFVPKQENPAQFMAQLKIAFAVGTKISKKAVERNRLRRRTQHAVRKLQEELRLKAGFFVLVIAKKTALAAKFKDIQQEIAILFKSAGVAI